MNKLTQIEELQNWIEKLRENKTIILVEGKKDKRALQKLGITSTILFKPLYKTIDFVSNNHKECIILTDLDKEGKKIFSKLRHHLQKFGVKIDNKFRNFLLKHTKLSHIEGLPKYLSNLQKF